MFSLQQFWFKFLLCFLVHRLFFNKIFRSNDELILEAYSKPFLSSSEHFLQNRFSQTFCKIHRKKLVLEFFSVKLQALACNFIKKRLQHRYFLVNFAKFLRVTFLQKSYKRLLLAIIFWIQDIRYRFKS